MSDFYGQSEYWVTAVELVELFGLSADAHGVEDWLDLVELSGPVLLFPVGYDFRDVVRALMRARRWSAVVFWSRIKRGIAPMLEAAPETWSALGVEGLEVGYSAPDLARAVARVRARRAGTTEADARAVAQALSQMGL